MKNKFRGFSERLNKLVYGYLVEDCMIVNGIVEVNDQYISIESWETVVPESVGQYTGLKDLNGVEIYEGDIVEFCDFDSLRTGGNTSDKTRKAKVVFIQGGYFVKEGDYEALLYDALINDSELTIIGNIYQNKDLLEDK